MFTGIGALAIYVTDKERAKEFYTSVLGFQVAADVSPTLCFLKSPNGVVDAYLEGGMTRSGTRRDATRLGFFLRTDGSARHAFAALRAAGVRLLQDEPAAVDDSTECFQLLDPDGNIIDVCGDRERP